MKVNINGYNPIQYRAIDKIPFKVRVINIRRQYKGTILSPKGDFWIEKFLPRF
jgi:hypothetical protein